MLLLSALVLQKDRGESEGKEKSLIGLHDPVVQCFSAWYFVFVFVHMNEPLGDACSTFLCCDNDGI